MHTEKRCSVCFEMKTMEQYQVRRASKDGRTAACRLCLSIRDARRVDQPKRVAKRKEIAQKRRLSPELTAIENRCKHEWIEKNRIKRSAHIAVDNAVRDRILIKPDNCERCGVNDSLHGHHEDYTKPLDVIWLCRSCHGKRHREINAERRKTS